MPRVTFELEAEFEDGSTTVVVADQRDFVKWEIWEHGGPFVEYPLKANLFFRYVAWCALVRGGYTPTWDVFAAACIEVHDTGGAGDETEDPGQAGASDGP